MFHSQVNFDCVAESNQSRASGEDCNDTLQQQDVQDRRHRFQQKSLPYFPLAQRGSRNNFR